MVKLSLATTGLSLAGVSCRTNSGSLGSEESDRGGQSEESVDGDEERGDISSGRVRGAYGLYPKCGPCPTEFICPFGAVAGRGGLQTPMRFVERGVLPKAKVGLVGVSGGEDKPAG